MVQFNIKHPDECIRTALIDKIDNLTKPKGSLGRLEELALKIGWIQQTLSPELRKPHNILFAADHGIIEEGVTVSPKEVTWQQLGHFSRGGAGINFLCHQHGFELVLVDAGVDYDIPTGHGIIDRKMRRGTSNFLKGPAMSKEELNECITRGAGIVDMVHQKGCNIVSFGEMGSGNTSPSSMWMSIFTGIPIADCIGAGAGLDNAGIQHKLEVLSKAMDNYHGDGTMEDKMAWFGGFEMAMAVGGMLRAAELGMIVLVDGFIMTSCMAAASYFYPEVLNYAIFGHQGDEAGHKLMLQALGVQGLLHLGLRLGEGTGAVCAYPILQSAVNMMNEMDSFANTDVTKYFCPHEDADSSPDLLHPPAYMATDTGGCHLLQKGGKLLVGHRMAHRRCACAHALWCSTPLSLYGGSADGFWCPTVAHGSATRRRTCRFPRWLWWWNIPRTGARHYERLAHWHLWRDRAYPLLPDGSGCGVVVTPATGSSDVACRRLLEQVLGLTDSKPVALCPHRSHSQEPYRIYRNETPDMDRQYAVWQVGFAAATVTLSVGSPAHLCCVNAAHLFHQRQDQGIYRRLLWSRVPDF